ncbi:MAG: hypothetical protein ABIV26_02630, partial [Candidatus Limnocylindrales bacterium]
PFVAQADVACGTEGNTGGWCRIIDEITGTTSGIDQPPDVKGGGFGGAPAFPVPVPDIGGAVTIGPDGVNAGVGVAADLQGAARDRYWPRSVITLLLLAVAFTTAAVQLVTPTRRWRPRLPGLLRRPRFRRTPE